MNAMTYENLFHAPIAEDVYLISTNLQGKSLLPSSATTNSYLVIGKEKALLFDLAVDDPALKRYAENLADRPVMLVLSHGHPDHIYNLNQFPDVWLHQLDMKFLRGGFLGMAPVEPCPKPHFLTHGDAVDLGSRVLDVIHIPGHTPGSILLLDRHTKILLSGDTVARRLLYGITDFVPLAQFCVDLKKLEEYDFNTMYSAHDRCALPKAHIETMLDVIQNNLPQTKRIVPVPGIGDLLCASLGVETELTYFDIALPRIGETQCGTEWQLPI